MIEPAAPAIDCAAAAPLMEPLTDLLVRAGSAILAINRNAMRVEGKLDGSPVTEADLASDRIIAEGLAQLLPEVPALSEERVQFAKPPYRGSFILVDPLDGTKEFVAGRDEFTVNLALVTNGVPLLGIIGAPALGLLWRGLVGRGAERLRLDQAGGRGIPEPIHTRAAPRGGEPWIAAVSRSHGDPRSEAFIDSRPGVIRQIIGSAVKFGRVAEGVADIYPRLSPTREWDVAAGHAVVTAAGGKVTAADGSPLRFGEGREGFIVAASTRTSLVFVHFRGIDMADTALVQVAALVFAFTSLSRRVITLPDAVGTSHLCQTRKSSRGVIVRRRRQEMRVSVRVGRGEHFRQCTAATFGGADPATHQNACSDRVRRTTRHRRSPPAAPRA